MKPPRPVYAYLSAAALALVTLATFFVFQDYGPQSVIRRFHSDVAAENFHDLDRITVEGLNSSRAQYLVSRVDRFLRAGMSYEIVVIKRSSQNTVQAVVQYVDRRGFGYADLWYVHQQDGEWRIDCNSTVNGIFRRSGLY